MGKSVYLTDPAVAEHYHAAPGTWAWVADDEEADWLIRTMQGYGLDAPRALPAAYFVHPESPQPFAPYQGQQPKQQPVAAAAAVVPRKALHRVTRTHAQDSSDEAAS